MMITSGSSILVAADLTCNTPKCILIVFSMFRVFCRYNANFS